MPLERRLLWIGWEMFALCMGIILICLLNPKHFPRDDLEGMFYGRRGCLCHGVVWNLEFLALTSILRERSALRQARARSKGEARERAAVGSRHADSRRNTGALQALVIVATVALIVAGALNGTARDLLYKAITICTECIGLG